ncbi:MAG: NAD/NADP octopine/nopaline dehydrogenase family protein [Bacillota bacterium]|nr:NAD/NADP octopine/nopaline dehydrogenase family protein [Bacillota bacterium]
MISIFGAGNGGLALSTYLIEKKYDVTLWNRSTERIKSIINNDNSINVFDYLGNDRSIKIRKITQDLELAVKSSKILIIITPGFAHRELADKMSKYLTEDQIIILMPGRTLGSYVFKDKVKMNTGLDIECFESQTILHTCRAVDNNLTIYAKKPLVTFSTNNLINKKNIELVNDIFPEFKYEENYYSVTLNNIGAILHPIPTILNTGRVDGKVKFKHYHDGITPKIAKYLSVIDNERKLVCESVNCKYTSVLSWLKTTYKVTSDDLHEAIKEVKAYENIYAPNTLNHRYIYDDLITGLVPIYNIGKSNCVEMPNTEAFIRFASNFMEEDFFERGRKTNQISNCQKIS